jgi:flagellar FliL protein
MAEQPLMTSETPTAGETPPAKAGLSSLLSKLKILAFVAVVIAAECALAYLYLPSSTETAALAGAASPPAAAGKKTDRPVKPGEEGEQTDEVEVDLGEFSVTAFQSASNSTMRIDFHLFGTVGAESGKEFAKLMEENRHRFREQVLVIVRGAAITDLADAGLGLIKRRILDKTNRTLGKPLLRTVVVSDFSFIEQ